MQTGNYYDPGTGDYLVVDGHIVERDALSIAERLQEYDENLVVMCLDVQEIGLSDAPFIICCKEPNGVLKRVFECWELNQSVIDRVIQADGHRFDALKRVETMEDFQKQQRENRYKDKHEEMKDIVATAMKQKSGHFKFKNDQDVMVTVHDDRPPTRDTGKSYSYGE